ETEFVLLAQIDEERAWPEIRALMTTGTDYKIRTVLQYLSRERKAEILKEWVQQGTSYIWYVHNQIEAVVDLETDATVKDELLTTIERRLVEFPRRTEERSKLLTRISAARRELVNGGGRVTS